MRSGLSSQLSSAQGCISGATIKYLEVSVSRRTRLKVTFQLKIKPKNTPPSPVSTLGDSILVKHSSFVSSLSFLQHRDHQQQQLDMLVFFFFLPECLEHKCEERHKHTVVPLKFKRGNTKQNKKKKRCGERNRQKERGVVFWCS